MFSHNSFKILFFLEMKNMLDGMDGIYMSLVLEYFLRNKLIKKVPKCNK